jgi:phospholipase/carboxylesterase
MGRFPNSVSWTPTQDNPTQATSFSEVAAGHAFFLPLHYTPGYKYPLVVWLHNNGFNENQLDNVMPYISVRNYIGVGVRATKAADAIGHRFDWHQGTAAIGAAHDAIITAIDEAIERFAVNTERIVLAGYRDGGTMALRIAMRQPDRFAAAVSLGGPMPKGAIRNIGQLREKRLPMLWQWGGGRAEFTNELLKSDCSMAMSIGGQVEIRQYPGDDEMDTVVLKDIDDWIMRRIVSQSSTANSDRWASSPTAYSAN